MVDYLFSRNAIDENRSLARVATAVVSRIGQKISLGVRVKRKNGQP